MDSNELSKSRHLTVVKANDLIQKSRFSLSLQQQKILLYLISKIDPTDESLKRYDFSIPEFCKTCGIDYDNGKNYRELKRAVKEIRDKSLWITLPNGNETLVSWIEKAVIISKSGTISIKLDEDMKPFLLQLKSNFTQYELIWTLQFRCKYSIRLYELIKSVHYMDLENYTRVFPLGQLRQMLGAETYDNFRDFHTRVLKPAVAEINKCSDKTLSYELIKKGRSVDAVSFTIGTKEAGERLALVSQIEQQLSGSSREG